MILRLPYRPKHNTNSERQFLYSFSIPIADLSDPESLSEYMKDVLNRARKIDLLAPATSFAENIVFKVTVKKGDHHHESIRNTSDGEDLQHTRIG